MASEYYKWLARDVRPEEEKMLTREEKWRNWWSYHKWHVIIGVFCLIFIANMGYDIANSSRNEPDYQIAYVGSTALPEEAVAELELALAELGEDLNGNGEVRVELQSYVLSEQSQDASMLLLMNIETAQSLIFLLEDPEAFSAAYPILTRVDGTAIDETPGSLVPTFYRWTDCPVLAALETQSSVEHLCIARRGLWNTEPSDAIDGALRLWDTLTEGAA